MTTQTDKTALQKRIESGKSVVLAQVAPPAGGAGEAVRQTARKFAGKVHALGLTDNSRQVRMSAMAAASLVAAEGVEPLWHLVTRDRNRIALVSDALGAQGLGVRNVLCTSGTHQTLGAFRAARNVFDIDSTQLIRLLANLPADGQAVGARGFDSVAPFCLGGVASPCADPLELQVLRLCKKLTAGATFLVTAPIFDLDRFGAWWREVTRAGLHEKAAIIAGVRVLTTSDAARAYAQQRPDPMIPAAVLERVTSAPAAGGRKAGIELACQTIEKLRGMSGLRGFDVCGDGDEEAALEVIAASGLRIE
ncbi:MAG: methylenetetrahydrofolate reductase [Planctomycetota bacterium]|nr:methylenetetrahydrofolate reductase [Planctomycetota bacterium]